MEKSREEGRAEAKRLPEQYKFADKELHERFEFRTIHPDDPEEIQQAVDIEQICFPPNEACSEKSMRDRIAAASDLFWVAVERKTGNIAGFLNGLSTDEYVFRDEFFTDVSLYNPDGRSIMLLGLDVLPEYRNQGLAHEIMYSYLRREAARGRELVILTCLEQKVKFYQKMGFVDRGISKSTWGDEEWHEMTYTTSLIAI